MTLDQYLRSGRKSAQDLSDATGLTVASISRIRNGLQKPSYDAIRALVEATGGDVRSDDLLGLAA